MNRLESAFGQWWESDVPDLEISNGIKWRGARGRPGRSLWWNGRGWEDYDGLMVGERRPSGKNLGSIGAIS